jgi:glycosyltransferase involved in cell wall biosynthesis
MFYVGTGTDEEKLKKQINDDGLTDNVIFTGKITDRIEISKYYNMADLFLFPSLYDASSLVQIEAASQKTPTVFLRGAATAATVTEDVNGYIAENSVEKFADKIEEIFKDEKKYKQICENAYKDLYVSWDKAVEKAYKDYLRVIENKKA